MDKRYEVYCLADRHFYETPDRLSARSADGGLLEAAGRPVPEGWYSTRQGDWLNIRPRDLDSPDQGWKIHVSACLDNAEKTAAKVWEYCVPRRVPFKFVPSRPLLHLRNSKYADRGGSGKFATLYPDGEAQLQEILRELGDLLDGEQGPYVLTDLRWGDGPLHVRYGGFTPRYCPDASGTLVAAIEDDRGRLVPDRREPGFHVPDWVGLPAFLEPHLAARSAESLADLPYRVERALHFSNGGGVYLGTDTRTGERVVLKEGRPHAGLASDGADAVARLERERAALEQLEGLGVAPGLRDWLTVGEHHFLVMEYLPGRTLNSFFAERHPLLGTDSDPRAVADYTRWALDIHRSVREAMAAVHSRGVVFNDLHMFNIMVDEDGSRVRLLDFEAAAHVDERQRQVVAHPGFIAPADRTGFATDHYALACLRLALFLPMTTLLAVDRGKAVHLAELISRHFPDVPPEFLTEAVAEITRAATPAGQADAPPAGDAPRTAGGPHLGPADWTPPARPGDWPRSRESMIAAILASATPEREDRLFPGDVSQFGPGGGLGLAHGAAGVLVALDEVGAPRYEAGERWLLRGLDRIPQGTPPGLYDGLMGAAYALARLDRVDRAVDLARQVLTGNWQRLAPNLFGGLAGVGLVLDHLARATGDRALAEQSLVAARLAARGLSQPGPRRAGLMYGATGAALLFLRLYERTADTALLDLAAEALRLDLESCVTSRSGSWQVNDGRRSLPYLGSGSVGIAMVLDDYLAHRADDDFERARHHILPAARSRFYAQPGLFSGRAGMVLHLSRTTAPGADDAALTAQIAGLDWYTMPYRGELAFPGDQMMRLSMDLATGTAGCLLALGAARHDRPVGLPFLPPPRRDLEPAPAKGS